MELTKTLNVRVVAGIIKPLHLVVIETEVEVRNQFLQYHAVGEMKVISEPLHK